MFWNLEFGRCYLRFCYLTHVEYEYRYSGWILLRHDSCCCAHQWGLYSSGYWIEWVYSFNGDPDWNSPFYCALSRKWGKRPIFLFSTLMAIIGTAVAEAATTFNMLMAGRIIQGFCISAFESLLVASVGYVLRIRSC
jgi:MFS family permease